MQEAACALCDLVVGRPTTTPCGCGRCSTLLPLEDLLMTLRKEAAGALCGLVTVGGLAMTM